MWEAPAARSGAGGGRTGPTWRTVRSSSVFSESSSGSRFRCQTSRSRKPTAHERGPAPGLRPPLLPPHCPCRPSGPDIRGGPGLRGQNQRKESAFGNAGAPVRVRLLLRSSGGPDRCQPGLQRLNPGPGLNVGVVLRFSGSSRFVRTAAPHPRASSWRHPPQPQTSGS